MKDWNKIEAREKPEKLTEYIVESKGNSTVNSIKKKDHDYYRCDYCNDKIILTKNKKEIQTGGLLEIRVKSHIRLNLALCNKCLNAAKKDINEFYKINI